MEKALYLLNDLSNFNKIFMKGVAYNNIKIHQKFHSICRKHFFGKTTEGSNLLFSSPPLPSLLRVNINLNQLKTKF